MLEDFISSNIYKCLSDLFWHARLEHVLRGPATAPVDTGVGSQPGRDESPPCWTEYVFF